MTTLDASGPVLAALRPETFLSPLVSPRVILFTRSVILFEAFKFFLIEWLGSNFFRGMVWYSRRRPKEGMVLTAQG